MDLKNKGFWIPVPLLYDKNLTHIERFLLAEIAQLAMLDKGCIASNTHFAKILNIFKQSVSRSLSNLQKKGYITIKIKQGSRNFSRTITLNKMLFDPKQNVNEVLTKCLQTKGNKQENITNDINNMSAVKDFYNKFVNISIENGFHTPLAFSDKRKTKIKERLKLGDKIINKMFMELSKMKHLSKEKWFDIDFVIRNDGNIEKIINHWMDWKINKSEENQSMKDKMDLLD